MPWGYAATALVGAYSANQQSKSAQGAANAISGAQQGQYEQTRQDLLPFMEAGQGAIPLLQQLSNGDYSGFQSSPDYQFALQQGIGNLDKSAAARGGLFGGGHQRELSEFNQGLASQHLGNYRGSLFNLAQLGQNAAAQTGQFGANAATNSGNAQAGYLQQKGDINSQFASGLGSLFNDWAGSRVGAQANSRQSSYGPANQGSYSVAGDQPAFGNNYANFGKWGY